MGCAASFLIWLLVFLPVFAVSPPIVFLLLLTKWDGKTTWFGNYLYGRKGNTNTPANPSLFDSWWFLVVRNPISNFGKFALSCKNGWLIDKTWGKFGVLYGWKNPDHRIDNRRPFVFRPYFKK
jgi:hypothetical protein